MDRSRNIFALLDQEGPFRVEKSVREEHLLAGSSRRRFTELKQRGLLSKYRVTRSQLFELLQVRSFAEIPALLQDAARRRVVEKRAYRLLGNMFGLDGSEREVIAHINSYSRIADGVINYLRNRVLANYASYIEMTNEIDSTRSPIDLLLILFDDRYHRKARFEAKRKLILMSLAGAIDQRERETEVEQKFLRFLDFLNDEVWSRKAKIGELDIVYLHSHHHPESFACQEVAIKRRQELPPQTGPHEKITMIKRRCFPWGEQEVPVYVSIRKKPPEAKVLKLLRKGEENPAVAVDDELGLMAVVDSPMEVKIFQQHLTASAARAGSLMTLEDLSDTLAGGGYRSSTPGSSSGTAMYKFFARMGGMRVEFIVHTNRSFLNYIYQRGVSHDEYEVRRIFDSGVADLLFPRDIYEIDIGEKKEALIRWFRSRIEEI
ncbi:hypothetical protein [Desulfurivibrio alkaliphilus]|uniref:Uncharacterized protein n=1 Tax=Desulfurivibrio alkaliphilus (strain DSM 19089 / UNIQEM U267 / AHT2) TaxID=589865 RepID=D6Z5W2_DESAT|nr:hypothetical protein [Desulfurivibrio alkaliphilus]ADH84844.1 conserved hypothetical protein [Desulfurivibrio alkaliphilus AHT 2]